MLIFNPESRAEQFFVDEFNEITDLREKPKSKKKEEDDPAEDEPNK